MKEIRLGKSGKLALIDDDDFSKVTTRRWHLDGKGYAVSASMKDGKRKVLRLHSFLLGKRRGNVIDHINRVKLDNRRDNLRFCTPTESNQNRPNQKNARNKYRGIKPTANGRFESQICYKGCQIHLGTFDTAEGAARAYDQKAKSYYGKFAVLNGV